MKQHYILKHFLLLTATIFLGIYSYAQVPAYYNGTDISQTGATLKTNLATLISDTHVTNLTYTPGVWDALKQTDLDPTNSNNVFLIYGYNDTDADLTNDRTRSKDMNGGNVGDWNREHTFPKSLGNPNLGTSGPGADAHHLRASDVQFNSLRNNHRFVDANGNAGLINGNSWYPGDEWKGDIARMIMYMYLRYGNQCLPSAVGLGPQNYHQDMMDIFLEWNAEDPVSQVEINRNVLLEGIQGNRNPFIDNPIFATTIWGGPQAEDRFNNGTIDVEAPTPPANLISANTTQTETILSWSAATDNVGVIAYQIFNGATLVNVASQTNYTVTGLLANTTYTFAVKAVDAAGNVSLASNTTTITTLEDITPPLGDFIVYQGYEGTALDTWGYIASPIPCNDGGNDVWDVVANVGSISTANTGANFFGVRDLDGNCGTTDGGELSFNTVDITGFQDVTLSFSVNVDGYDVANGDTINYQVFYDDVAQGEQAVTIGSPFSTTGWEQVAIAIPNTVNTVRFSILVKQNGGSDYAGFDDVQLHGTAISMASFLINEVDADTAGTDTLEFLEIYDGGVGNTALDGLVVVMYNGSNNLSYGAYDLDGQTTNTQGYFVLGNTDVPNVDMILPGNGLQNGADAVAIYTGDVTDFPSNTPVTTNNLLDAFVYDTSDADDAELLVLLNAGEAQINENGAGDKDAHSSQRVPNGAGGARNTSTYNQLLPSPGVENSTPAVTDTESPTAPTNVVASSTTETEAILIWDAATDNVAVTTYEILNGTTQVGTTTDTTITITGLNPNTTYSLTIVALDAAGNVSEMSLPVVLSTAASTQTGSALVISGVIDGPLSGGIPKGIELYVIEDIADLSIYGIESANNGGGSTGEEFTFPADVAVAGDYIYIASEASGFTSFFGFAPNYTNGAASINGDDAMVLFKNGVVVDVFGDVNVDGSNQPWEYVDGWAYRIDNTGVDGSTFVLDNWIFSGTNALDGTTTNATAAIPFPVSTYTRQASAAFVINELDADTAGTDTLEFLEIYDGGVGNAPLDGLVVVLYNGSSDTSYNAIDLDGFTTNAEGYFVIGNTAVPNVSIVIPSNGLQNGADAVAIYTADATDFPNGTAVTTANLLDALVYDTNDGDDAGLLVLLNAGEAQINEGELGNKDGHSLQRIPNGAGGRRNTTTYTQANPTPGTENGAVIPPPAVITILEAKNTNAGELVTVSGVLTVSDQFSGSAYVQDTTGAIAIFDEMVHGDGNFMIGDSITVTGTLSAFNEQIQLSQVTTVENNGLPNQTIEPLSITLSELANHPAELVRIMDPSFPSPGDILFGNSNYTLTDLSGNGQLRIDNDVAEIVGLGQPEICNEITGVVGRFFQTYQLLPRMGSDMSCAGPYIPPILPIDVSKDKTLDFVTWNIEWFGDEANSPAAGNPMSDAIQKDSAKTVITRLNADIYAVEEIADDVLFAQMVSELPGYNYILSEATSYPNDTEGTKQKVGFIYKTSTVAVVSSKALLTSIHPYYNGGDDSALTDYPVADKTRFFASGRLPFMMTANITIDGQSEPYHIVALHARANGSSGAQDRYDMRKYDVEVLKDSLDAHYANANIILLGDYNDDVDVTVADVNTTVSSFESYASDTQNYTIVSKVLSEAGLRSYVFRENMIDHITISNELNDNYIDQSASVHYEFYDNDYPTTTSDHFPVSARFQLKALAITDSLITNVSCYGAADGTATVTVTGGITPYEYEWSDGQTTITASELVAGTYSVIIMDALGNSLIEVFTIEEPSLITASTSENTTVYFGYPDAACTTLSLNNIEGGTAPYTYLWSTGESGEEITVCPETTTTYTLTITDANGCTIDKEIVVEVVDVQCGNNPNNPKVQICHNGHTICVSQRAVQRHLDHGDVLGACPDGGDNQVKIRNVRIFPNPFRRNLNIKLNASKNTKTKIAIFNLYGNKVFQSRKQLKKGNNVLHYNLRHLPSSIYFLKIFVNGKLKKVRTIIKS